MGKDSRDSQWFTAIYASHYSDIVRYGLRRRTDPGAAAELAQEVFIVAWRRRADVPDRSLPWLYGVARNLLAQQRRRNGTSAGALVDDRIAAEAVGSDAATVVADVRAAVSRLTEPDQEILRLVGWEELTVAEAAQVLGCTQTTARVRLHRARRRLRTELDRPASPRAAPGAQRPIDVNPLIVKE